MESTPTRTFTFGAIADATDTVIATHFSSDSVKTKPPTDVVWFEDRESFALLRVMEAHPDGLIGRKWKVAVSLRVDPWTLIEFDEGDDRWARQAAHRVGLDDPPRHVTPAPDDGVDVRSSLPQEEQYTVSGASSVAQSFHFQMISCPSCVVSRARDGRRW
ncbi:hypothetical protein AXA44_37045 [Rhodococcus sp. SC4]|nr:hypothetical protein AXA44_37045 [Rhodococcus sp. SC4]